MLSTRWLCGATAFAMAMPATVTPYRICGVTSFISLAWCVINAIKSLPGVLLEGRNGGKERGRDGKIEGGRGRKVSDDIWINHLQPQCFDTTSSFKLWARFLRSFVFVGISVVFHKQLGRDMLIAAAKYQSCNGANIMQ